MHTPDKLTEYKAVLKNTNLFAKLADPALDELAQTVQERTFAPGKDILTRNAQGDEFYVVAQGTVELYITTHPSIPSDTYRSRFRTASQPRTNPAAADPTSQDALLDTRSAGDYFGEVACLEAPPDAPAPGRTASAKAPRGCTLLVIPGETLRQYLQRFPEVGYALSRQLASRLRVHTNHLARGILSPKARAERDRAERNLWQWFSDGMIWFFSNRWVFVAHLVVWVAWGTIRLLPANAFPGQSYMTVSVLTNIVSLEAIILAIVILVADRRKDERDESRDDTQHTCNTVTLEQNSVILQQLAELKAELQRERLQARLRQPHAAPPQSAPNSAADPTA